jgi:hypothetical protein
MGGERGRFPRTRRGRVCHFSVTPYFCPFLSDGLSGGRQDAKCAKFATWDSRPDGALRRFRIRRCAFPILHFVLFCSFRIFHSLTGAMPPRMQVSQNGM